jgi:hypothetical protein
VVTVTMVDITAAATAMVARVYVPVFLWVVEFTNTRQ